MASKKRVFRSKSTRTQQLSYLESAWNDTRRALRSAETTVGRRVAALVDESGVPARKVLKRVTAWSARLDREGRKASQRVEARFAALEQSVQRERRTLARGVDGAITRTLAALNIPTRHDVQQLSRRVEQLSRRVEALR